jgi:PhoH-like ATPase
VAPGRRLVDSPPWNGSCCSRTRRCSTKKIIEVELLTSIRSRSIRDQGIIGDEAQNLSPHEVKTVIARAGEVSNVVLAGDLFQVNNPYVDATSNGLTSDIEWSEDSTIAGHITPRKGERSDLAELAARLL